jgi:hypothetical protein
VTESTFAVKIQKYWNWVSVIVIVLFVGHFFSTGPLKVPLGVIDKAAAEQIDVDATPDETAQQTRIIDAGTADLSSSAVLEPKRELRNLKEVDAIHLAVSLGRLDFASLGLTIIGVVLAVLGLIGFLKIDRETKSIASSVARDEAKVSASEQTKNYLLSEAFKGEVERLVELKATEKVPEAVQRYLDRRTEFDSQSISGAESEGYIPNESDN